VGGPLERAPEAIMSGCAYGLAIQAWLIVPGAECPFPSIPDVERQDFERGKCPGNCHCSIINSCPSHSIWASRWNIVYAS
jgi:hypothetical protein